MSILTIGLVLVVALGLTILVFSKLNKTANISELLGRIAGETANQQTWVIFNKVLDNEDLFNLVRETGSVFTGYDKYDVNNINTSKFAKLVAANAPIKTQVTSAERYFRSFRAEMRNSTVVLPEIAVNG